jgi:hypothetical protein
VALTASIPFEIAAADPHNPTQSGISEQEGGRLFGIGKKVAVEILEAESAYTSEIRLVSPRPMVIGTDDQTGLVARLGRVASAVELVFAITVLDTGETFFTGPAERNPDDAIHAVATTNGDGSFDVRVGFEDLSGDSDGDFNDVVFRVSHVAQQRMSIDIRPGKKVNRVNVRSRSAIPVAIFGAPSFDVTSVDVESVCFGAAAKPLRGDCTARTHKTRIVDVNGDQIKDLKLYFDTRETRIVRGDTRACMVGQLANGTGVVGCDSVVTTKGRGPKHGKSH